MANKIVTYNLQDTIFKFEMDDTTFYFIRKLTLNKFKKGYLVNRSKFKNKFENMYLINVNFDNYADFYFYHMCQRNAFRVVKGGEEITCLNDIILDGQIRTKKISKELSKISTQK